MLYRETQEFLLRLEKILEEGYGSLPSIELSNELDHFIFEIWTDGYEQAFASLKEEVDD